MPEDGVLFEGWLIKYWLLKDKLNGGRSRSTKKEIVPRAGRLVGPLIFFFERCSPRRRPASLLSTR